MRPALRSLGSPWWRGWLVGPVVLLYATVNVSGQARSAPRRARQPLQVSAAVNGGYAAATKDFRDGATFRTSGESGRFDADYAVKAGSSFDVSGGVRLWRNLGVGVGFTRASHTAQAAVTGSVPHPFFFNRARTVGGDVTGIARNERAVHVGVSGTFPLWRTSATVFGGPSFVHLEQGLVPELGYTEQYPYDVATFRAGIQTRATGSAVGAHAGADIAYFFTQQLGVGFGVMVTTADVDVTSAGGGSLRLGAGSVQAGGGLRLRF